MGLSDSAGGMMPGLGFGDPVVRIGVTGLSRAGKTVFITSLVANLLDRGSLNVDAIRSATARAASRRGSSMTIRPSI